jgi:hypothetical protein
VEVHCREIHGNEVSIDVDARTKPVTLKIGGEKIAP